MGGHYVIIATMAIRGFLKIRIVALMIAALMAAEEAASDAASESDARPVKLITIAGGEATRIRQYPAVVEAAQTSDLAFQVGGVISELNVTEARRLAVGDVIARLDARDFENKLAQAQAQFDHAESEYQRAQNLIKEDAISQSVLEQRKSQRDFNQAALKAAEKTMDDAVLRAPFAGIIAEVYAENYENIKAQETVVRMFATEELLAVINVPSSDILNTRQTKIISLNLRFSSSGDSIPAAYKEAVLDPDSATQTYRVKFSFAPPPQLNVLPGMNAELTAKVRINELSGDIAVPLAAVLSDGEGQFVWLVNSETMQVTKRRITVKNGVGEFLSVAEGLDFGDTIVGAGASFLSEGMTVRAWEGADNELR